jgi:hypothetical protein
LELRDLNTGSLTVLLMEVHGGSVSGRQWLTLLE